MSRHQAYSLNLKLKNIKRMYIISYKKITEWKLKEIGCNLCDQINSIGQCVIIKHGQMVSTF